MMLLYSSIKRSFVVLTMFFFLLRLLMVSSSVSFLLLTRSQDKMQLIFCILIQITWNNLTGKMVIKGNPSNDFHPYMPLSQSVVRSSREKLLVNFDPAACFLQDLKVKLKLLKF
jgi:hypothetical protein